MRAAVLALLPVLLLTGCKEKKPCGDVPDSPAAALVRLDLATGTERSQSSRPYGEPVYQRSTQLVTLDNSTGADVPFATIDPSPAARSPFGEEEGRHLLTVDGHAVLLKGDVVVGEQVRPRRLRWRSSDHGYRAVQAEGDGRRAYATGVLTTAPVASRWRVYAIEPLHGDVKWAQSLVSKTEGTAVLVRGDRVLVAESDQTTGGSGAVEAFDRETGRRLWTARLPQGTVTTMSTLGDEVVLTTRSTAHYCY